MPGVHGRTSAGIASAARELRHDPSGGQVILVPEHSNLDARPETGISHGHLRGDQEITHPDLQGLRRFMLVTREAHGQNEPLGYRSPEDPTRHMEIVKRDVERKRVEAPGVR